VRNKERVLKAAKENQLFTQKETLLDYQWGLLSRNLVVWRE
jgi:hypothetical protein